MGDVTLLVGGVEEVRHWTHSPDTDIVSPVGLTLDGLSRGLQIRKVCGLIITQREPVYVGPVSGSRSVQLLKAWSVT